MYETGIPQGKTEKCEICPLGYKYTGNSIWIRITQTLPDGHRDVHNHNALRKGVERERRVGELDLVKR